MSLERRNPLPVGLYWIDIFSDDMEGFRAWLERNREGVDTISTESFPASTAFNYPARDWYLFEVTEPVNWEGPGFPDIAASKNISSEDTARRPPPPKGPIEQLEDATGTAKVAGTLLVVGITTLAGLALWKAVTK